MLLLVSSLALLSCANVKGRLETDVERADDAGGSGPFDLGPATDRGADLDEVDGAASDAAGTDEAELSAPFCGDGEVNQGTEACDDGNRVDDDDCANDCTVNLAEPCAPCASDADCGTSADLCLALLDGGFCGRDCSAGEACPEGFECAAFEGEARQCAPLLDFCEVCPDADDDDVCDHEDICSQGDDAVDSDGDLVPDACDICPEGDDRLDENDNGTPDACDCDAAAAEACHPVAICVSRDSGFECICRTGYRGDGFDCTDIDECLEGLDLCSGDADCLNVQGGYQCRCREGFTGNGFVCQDINECDEEPCDENATCTNTVGDFGCECEIGWVGNGFECFEGYACVGPEDCDANASCVVSPAEEDVCQCNPGWVGNGVTCGDVLECDNPAINDCDENAECIELVGSYDCECDIGWEGDGFDCVLTDCGTPATPANGLVSAPTTTYGGTATYACDPGYDLMGDASRTCQADGSWSGAAPSCQIKDCGGLSAPTHGSVDTSDGTTYESTATYACSPGYDLIGESTRACQANGSWSGAAPSCQIKDCGGLSAPTDGTVDTSGGTTYESVATYDCDPGYDLIGDATRACQADGSWSGAAPSCQIKDCGGLPAPADGTVDTSGGTTYQSVATYDCNPGYDLIGDTTRTCQANGSWGGAAPTCQIKDCGELTGPSNGSVDTSGGTTYGSTAIYACNVDFALSGTATRICQADATWSGDPPTCWGDPIDCVCDGQFSYGEWLRSAPSAATPPAGTPGSVMAGTDLTPPLLVDWDGWTGGHDGNCEYAVCGVCEPQGSSRWYVDCDTVSQVLSCACTGLFLEGDRVRATVASPASASGIGVGSTGTVVAGQSGGLEILVEWDDWTSGHSGICSWADCGRCVSAGNSRWWVNCSDLEFVDRPQLTCACGGAFRAGSRVEAAVDGPASAGGLLAGHRGTVIAGTPSGLPILVEWDDWTRGHDGNCSFAACGTCVDSGNSRWWVNCRDLNLLVP